jgi:hypothetical protein
MLTTPFRVKSESQVNTSDAPVVSGRTSFQGNPQVVALPAGGYVVVWEDDSGTHNPQGKAIVGQRYDVAGNKVGGEVKLSGFSSGSQFAPKATFVRERRGRSRSPSRTAFRATTTSTSPGSTPL